MYVAIIVFIELGTQWQPVDTILYNKPTRSATTFK